ncbi:hypothetical protein [Gelria sp. Kuro-4]|uniref:hypothetical protein n=1 Tax=Gelria sp. Kuro-4 TaxID=2796927 RepID=UPI001BF05FAF|nr:hypothetical protein [Gelria sp. Kuro-4]BCV24220.1 hypothetical protein kuro4_09930 [Gelria sp. Kuro-4]
MLIEGLIRLGRPLAQAGLTPGEVLRLISDVASPNARNFLAHVMVVEMSGLDGDFRACVLPVQQWGDYVTVESASTSENTNGSEDDAGPEKKPTSRAESRARAKTKTKEVFMPDIQRAVGAPFVLPKGGNPREAQGCYGIPIYPVYDGDLKEFPNDPKLVRKFIAGRLKRTPGLGLSNEQIEVVAREIHRASQRFSFRDKAKAMGLVVLTAPGADTIYELRDRIPQGDPYLANIGPSLFSPGKQIVARLDKALKAFIAGRLGEGKEGGEIRGSTATCAFCGNTGYAVSAYCKAWPWFLPEWSCPQPITWNRKKDMVKGIAVCPECYMSFVYGANAFMKLAAPLDDWLTREIFSPVASARRKETSRKGGRAATIFGCAYALPLLDESPGQVDSEGFATGLQRMLTRDEHRNKLDVHLGEITGFEMVLPEEFSKDDYRLTLTYYSGDPGRGDIHLRATVEDVIPSTARSLTNLARHSGDYALEVAKHIYGKVSDRQAAFLRIRYSSLPYLLNAAFGAPYLWSTLASFMHRAPISRQRFLSNSAARMGQLSHGLPDTRSSLIEEVIFYLTFDELLRKYTAELMGDFNDPKARRQMLGNYQADLLLNNGGDRRMREWKELQHMLEKVPAEEMAFVDSEELGFGCGHLISLFSRQYWKATKTGDDGKDFLKHRVMTFGSDLGPDSIWKQGLSKMEEYARRLDMHLTSDFRKRLGIVLVEYSKLRTDIAKNRDAFMAAFWAGYELAGAPSKAEES